MYKRMVWVVVVQIVFDFDSEYGMVVKVCQVIVDVVV